MGFSDKSDPSLDLRPPKVDEDKDEPDGGPVKAFLETGNLLSPSWVISKGLEYAFDFNPVDEAKELLGGNWVEYAQCAKAWTALGKFCESLSENISSGNKSLDESWNGNAADASFVYFDTLVKDLESMKKSFDQLHDYYDDVCKAVYYAAEAAGDLLSGILDMALIVGLTAAAGASTSFTLVGPVVAAGAVAFEVIAMVNMWSKITTIISTVQTTVSGTTGLAMGVGNLTRAEMVKFPIVGSGYDNPAV